MIVRSASIVALCSALVLSDLGRGEEAAPAAKEDAAAPAASSAGRAIVFTRDVMPMVSRLGCNAAQCHGAFSGQGGMALSLFAGSPRDDYETLVKAERARRVNRWDPARSLLLLKATATIDHGGGQKIAPDSPEYKSLLAWIEQGARYDDPSLPQLQSVTLGPAEITLAKGAEQPIAVTAVYSDGARVDVTSLAAVRSGDGGVVAVDGGKLRAAGFGMGTVVAEYARHFGVQRVVVPQPVDGPFPGYEPQGKIDELVLANLKKLGLPPAEPCTDEVFLRRVYLDMTGTLPTPAEARAFLEDTGPKKRSELIARLFEREAFVQFWALKWSDLLRIKAEDPVSLWPKGAETYYQWVYASVAENKPYDQFARELLTATGSDFRSGPSNFFRAVSSREPLTYGESAALVFMGARLSCARCHGHPDVGWGLEDDLGMGAFFAQVKLKLTDEWKEQIVYRDPHEVLRHPRTGLPVASRPLGGEPLEIAPGVDPRAELARWLTAAENPWFARNIVNRVWYWLMGRGIVHEPDDMRSTNLPENPALLDHLAEELVSHDYDLRHIYRLILSSRTYQSSSVPHPLSKDGGGIHFAHYNARRLTAEQVLDALAQVTEVQRGDLGAFGRPTLAPITSLPEDIRAISVSDGSAECTIAASLGRPARATGFESERGMEIDRDYVAFLASSSEVSAAINSSPRIKRMLEAKMSDAEIVEELFLAGLARLPRESERQKLVDHLVTKKSSRAEAVKDIMWAVLNANGFVLNQ